VSLPTSIRLEGQSQIRQDHRLGPENPGKSMLQTRRFDYLGLGSHEQALVYRRQADRSRGSCFLLGVPPGGTALYLWSVPLQQPEVDDRAAFEAELADLIPEAPEKPLKRIGLRRDQTKEQRARGERAKQEFARELEQLFPARETTAGEKFSIGATESMADIAKAPELELKFAEFLGVPVETIERHAPILRATAIGARKLADMGRELHQAAREAEPFPAQDFTSQALRGAGSTLPFAVAGPLAGELGVALVGGAQSAVPLYEDVLAETGDEKKAWTGAAIGFGLGLTEAAGVGSILSKLDRASAGTFKKALIRVAAESSQEALQEWLQTGGQDIATKVLTGKDIRYLQETLPQQGQASAIGALLGGAISGGVEATGHALPGEPQQAPGAQGELTAEDVFAEDVKGQVVGQGGKVRLTGEGGRAPRTARTVADVGTETAPKGKAKEPKTEDEAAQAIAEGRPLELEQLQAFPGAIKKAAEIVHAPKRQGHAPAKPRSPSLIQRMEGVGYTEATRRAIAEGWTLPNRTNKKLTPGAPQIAPGEAEKPARAEPASTEKASQEPSGDAGAPGVSSRAAKAEGVSTYIYNEEEARGSSRQPSDVVSDIQLVPIDQPQKVLSFKPEEEKVLALMETMRKGEALPAILVSVPEPRADQLERPVSPEDQLVVDDGGHRLEAARRLAKERGYTHIPVRVVFSAEQARELRVEGGEEIQMKSGARLRVPIFLAGKRVGSVLGQVTDEAVHIFASRLEEGARGKGLASAAYKRIAKQAIASGREVWSDNVVSLEAARLYESLAREGYTVTKASDARRVEKPPGEQSEMGPSLVARGPVFRVTKAEEQAEPQPLGEKVEKPRGEEEKPKKGLHSESAKKKRAARKEPAKPTEEAPQAQPELPKATRDLRAQVAAIEKEVAAAQKRLARTKIRSAREKLSRHIGALNFGLLSARDELKRRLESEAREQRAATEAAQAREVDKPAAEEAGAEEIGATSTLMGVEVVLADRQELGGMAYEIHNAAKGTDKRAVVRVVDLDSGRVAGIQTYPSFKAAADAYARAVEAEGGTVPGTVKKAEELKPGAYKRYLIKELSGGGLYIEKEGFLIGHAKDVADARRIIDELTAKPAPAVTEAVTQAKAEIEYADLGIEPEVDEDIDEQTSDGSVVADPGDLPNSMQGGFPADPIVGGGASPRAPIGDRLYGRLEIDPGAPKPGERVSAPQIIEQLSKVVAASGGKTPIRWGRMGTVRSRGFFRVEPEVIRVKTANNIATATHEVGHALEKHVFGWPKGGPWVKPIASRAMQEELVKLGRALYGDKRPAAGYKREGFAEFVRLFVSDPAKAKAQAPQFSAWFEGEFAGANPAVMRELLETRRLVERWGEQGSLERARASMVDPASWGERWKRLKARTTLFAFKRAWTEIGEAYHVFAREAERKMGRLLDPVEDPFMLFQAFRMTHSARVRRMVSSGMIDLWGNRTGPALDEIRSLVRGRFDDFSIFLWAKRAKALWTDPLKGPRNPGLSEADADQIIADLSTPHFELAAGKVYEWLDGVLSYAAQASPSFRKVVDRIREVDPGSYIPLQRVFDTLDALWNETRSATARYSGSGIVSALKGSGRSIKNPIQAMLANAERTVLAAHRRLILDATIKLGQVEGMGHMIEEVPIDKRPVDVQLEQILRILGNEHPELLAEGVEGPLALGDFVGEALTFFAPAQFPKGQDPVIPIWDGNKVRWYWVDHRLASALAGLDLPRLPKIADILLGIPNRLFRAGTTGLRASFGLITNPIRDAPTFWMNTRSRSWAPQLFGRYYAEMAKAAGSAVTGGKYEGPYLRAFMDLGGAMATPLGPDSQEVQRAARELVQTGKWRYLDPRNWFEFYKDLVQFPETGTRAAELRGIAEQVGWHPGEPMSPNQALQMLLGAKQVTADFTAAGALARVANQVAPFVTASIAGNRAAVRAARRGQHPLTHFSARYAFRGLQMAAATLALWWLNKDEEWYQELEAKAKFAFWHVAFRWQGQNEVVAIPRPFEIGAVFAALPEMLADAWYRQEPETARKWFAQFFETLNPLSLPAPIEEAAEQLANRDFYWDTPIVPTGELRRSPEEQAGEYTSRVASFLGELFGVSPRRIDHAIRGTMGGVAADVVSVLGLGPPEKEREAELADAPVLGRLFKRGGPLGTSQQSIEDLYAALAAAQAIQASAKRDETPMERNKRLMLEDATEATAALGYVRTQTRSVDKRRKITEEIVDIARAALEQYGRDVAQRGEAKAALRSAKARKENQKKGILSK
jgi:hypothetical protein